MYHKSSLCVVNMFKPTMSPKILPVFKFCKLAKGIKGTHHQWTSSQTSRRPHQQTKKRRRTKKNEAAKATEMKLTYCASFLLLVIPVIYALPTTENQPTGTGTVTPGPADKQCDLDIQESTGDKIRGVFKTDDVVIAFYATKQDGGIHATTTTVNPPDSSISVYLSLPDIEGRVVPNIEELIVQHAEDLVESSNCQIPTNLNVLHEELADKLYECTKELGMTQLRFSIMYLETVVASALRICKGAETICTTSPKYMYGEGLFVCKEDLEELYPEITGSDMELTQRQDDEGPSEEGRVKRWGFSCPGLTGRDHGCCSNYAGPCRYCSRACLWHDRACSRCQHWWCGWRCRPDN